jgi:hypothetical protein
MYFDELAKSGQGGRHSKKLQMQGARILRSEAYIEVRRNDERRSATLLEPCEIPTRREDGLFTKSSVLCRPRIHERPLNAL